MVLGKDEWLKCKAEWLKFRDALAIVESSNDPGAIGDDGRAFGRYQMHPVWVIRNQIGSILSDTWDMYFERCLLVFFADLRGRIDDNDYNAARQIAQAFHVGHLISLASPDWDKNYDEKFKRALLLLSNRDNDSV